MKYNIKLPYDETRDIEEEEKILNLLCNNNYMLKKSTEPKTLFKDIYISKNSLDAHCWCEKNGEVVFDIDYPDRDSKIKLLHRLTDKKIYKKFVPLLQKLCFKSVEPHIEECFKSVEEEVKIKIDKKMFAEILLAGSHDCENRCFLFGYCYKLLNPDVELVCGSMGWEGVDGEPHYEWG
tara:strand:- start:79 stop:615 length:537 start_codon:yes stop_codon:yes gene_type:complete